MVRRAGVGAAVAPGVAVMPVVAGVFRPGGGVPGAGTMPGVVIAPGGWAPGTGGATGAAGVGRGLSLKFRSRLLPAYRIFAVFSLPLISSTSMSPCLSCSAMLKYWGFALPGWGAIISQTFQFLPAESELNPVSLTLEAEAGLVGGEMVVMSGGGFRAKGFRSRITW